MIGELMWWSRNKNTGVISVVHQGISYRYFLAASRILQAPEVIQAGQFVKFETTAPPPAVGLLPSALGVIVSNEPFPSEVNTGAATLLEQAVKP